MIKPVLIAFFLLISQVFADRIPGHECTELEHDLYPVCDSSGFEVLTCEAYYDEFEGELTYRWTVAEHCGYCCELPAYPAAYCTDSRKECLEDGEEFEVVKQEECHVKKFYNRFRRE